MDGPALSGRERRLLAEIEGDLRRDTRLDRRLSTMGARPRNRLADALRGLGRRVPSGVLMTALVMSAVCLSIAVRKPTAAVAVASAVIWVGSVALASAVAALLRRRRRRRGEPVDGLPDDGHREHRGGWWQGEPTDGGGGREQARDRQERRERRPWDHPEA
ncbi:hypothetical protein ACFCX4_09660 [Kitasatospora sp. NPDC056327]|uniref:hypothetical protein n=1 Tax=Kitasatospora sp. NPDC056327 TaxID=3345785 RepID=UPI0035DF9F81